MTVLNSSVAINQMTVSVMNKDVMVLTTADKVKMKNSVV